MTALVQCAGCGAEFPDIEGPVHRYIESSPGCWAAYGEVLAREYSNVAFASVHRLTVDSYAVQHPGRPSPQSIQSVALHLISLSLVLEHGVSTKAATNALRRCTQTKDLFIWLDPPTDRGSITVSDVCAVDSPEAHVQCVWEWSRAAWQAWSQHHETIEVWIRDLEVLSTLSA